MVGIDKIINIDKYWEFPNNLVIEISIDIKGHPQSGEGEGLG